MVPSDPRVLMLRRPKLLQLSDEDLRAIGEVAAQWSLASAILEILLFILTSSNPLAKPLISKRLISFDTRADACKKIFKTCFAEFPVHKEIGLALMSRGKQLSTERNIALHWPASRAGAAQFMQFADIDFEKMQASKRQWTPEMLLRLSDTIADWIMDVGHLKLNLILNGPLASLTTCNGPKIDMGTLKWENFRTIRKDHSSAMRQECSPQPQPSQA